MSATRTENAFMASLFADLDASIFSEDLSPERTRTTPSQSDLSTQKIRSSQAHTSRRPSLLLSSSIKLSQSPSPKKKIIKRSRRADSQSGPSSSQIKREAERAEEVQSATQILLENGDDWMHDLLSPSPKRVKRDALQAKASERLAFVNGRTSKQASLPQIALVVEETPRRYTRCIVEEVSEGHYIPMRYHTGPSERYTTKDVLPQTVTSAMQRRQKILYLSELETIEYSSSSEKQDGKQKKGKRCRVILRDEWLTTPVCPGDIIHLIGEWKEEVDKQIGAGRRHELETSPEDPDEALWDGLCDMPDSSPSARSSRILTMTLASGFQSVDIIQGDSTKSQVDNLLILHPDILLSATAVSTVIRCTRRSYLQSKIKASGPSGEDSPSDSLLMGKMLHEVLQSCLTGRPKQTKKEQASSSSCKAQQSVIFDSTFPLIWRGPKPTDFSSRFVAEQIESQVQCSLEDILSAGLDTLSAAEKLWEAAKPFGSFASRYLVAGEDELPQKEAEAIDTRSRVSPLVRVKQVLDVEEDIWSPMYGLKGFVDVSVEVELLEEDHLSKETSKEAPKRIGKTLIMPLELKTGRSIDKIQHQAQTMLYTLMMSDRYNQSIDSGLLYYSKSSTLHLIRSNCNEIRGLLMARNELADYLSRRPEVDQSKRELPPTIDNERDCGRCYVANECMLYKRTIEGGMIKEEESPIASIYQAKVSHLNEQHSQFFKHWEHLLTLEEDDVVRFRRQLWTMTAAARESTGRCLSNLTLARSVDDDDTSGKHSRAASGMNDRIVYHFFKADQVPITLAGNFAVGDPVSVSIEPDMYSVAQGHLLKLSSDLITVAVDRNLRSLLIRFKNKTPIFRIDKEEFANGMAKVRYNLAKLFFEAPHGDIRRRELIVDLRKPQFSNISDTLSACVDENDDLNKDQKAAVLKVMTAEDYALIVGMPGTGKTTTIVELIKQLINRGNSILLTSYTHSAVDTICRKLAKEESVKLLRLGSTDRVHSDILSFIPKQATSVEDLEEQLMRPNVVATTCLSISHALFGKRTFDYCIVDEASQITLPTCLGPLRYADKFVLVGDSLQLPPLVKNTNAKAGGLDVSLFDLLQKAHPQAVAPLRVQYRMNQDIMKLSNQLVYNGKLRCGNDEVGQSYLRIPLLKEARTRMHPPGSNLCDSLCWMERVFNEETRALFINTDNVPGRERRVGETLLENDVEADIVTQISAALVCAGVPINEIAIITPYRQQLRALIKRLGPAAAEDKIEVLTADKSQGRDKDVVLISFVRSKEQREAQAAGLDDIGIGQLLNDAKRINVALTRARKKLIIVGSQSTLTRSPLLKRLWDLMDSNSWTMTMSAKQLQQHQSLVSSVFAPSASPNQTTPIKKRSISSQSLLHHRRILLDVVNEIN